MSAAPSGLSSDTGLRKGNNSDKLNSNSNVIVQLLKLQVHKVYSYEPGKNVDSPLSPTIDVDKDTKDEKADNKVEKKEELDNPNEFKPSLNMEKSSSQNIEEKKLLNDVIDAEEKNNKELDLKLKGLYLGSRLISWYKFNIYLST